MKNIYVLFIVLGLSFFSCQQKEVLPMNGEITIAPEFQPYVNQFVEEAAIRGNTIDFSDTGLIMQFSTLSLGTAAQCQELGDDRRGNHNILFDETLWALEAPPRKAFLVFHELGHCELGRNHLNAQLANEEWKSMMQGAIANATLSDKDQGRPVVFYGFRRDYYLDELFDETTTSPDWSNRTIQYSNLASTVSLFDTINSSSVQKSFDLASSNYQLDISLQRLNPTGDVGIKYGTLESAYVFKVTDNKEVLIELTGQITNKTDFFNGSSFLLTRPYRLFFCNDLSFSEQEFSLSIRQQDGLASFFLEEQFIFHVDAIGEINILVGAIQNNNNLKIKNFRLTAL